MVTGVRVTEQMTNNSLDNTNKKLSIQVRLDGLSFFVQDLDTDEVVHYKNHLFTKKVDAMGLTEELEKFYASQTILKEAYKKVEVVYVNALFTFVPLAVFKEDFLSDYLKFNTKILATDYIAHDILEEQEMVCVYVPYTNCNNLLFDYYGSFEYHHCMSILVKKSLSTISKDTADSVFVNVYHTSFQIVVHKEKQLVLANSFDFTTKEDFIYYVLFTLEQLSLDPETVEVQLAGNITKESPLFQIAYTYIRNVSICNKSVSEIAENDYLSSILV